MLTLEGTPSHHYWEAQRINSAVVALGPTLMQLRSTNTTFVRQSSRSNSVLDLNSDLDQQLSPQESCAKP